jgi:hypothetical protein
MSIQGVSAEQLAELFYHFQALAPDFAHSQPPTPESWDEVPEDKKKRAVVAARLALLELRATTTEVEDSQRYFAKPGEAEWGC